MTTKELQPKQGQATPGTWATGKTLVKGRYDKLEAENISDDTDAWVKVLPGPICGTTPLVTVDGRTAVLFKDRHHGDVCNQVALIDLDTGEKTWQATFPGRAKMGYTDTPTTVTMARGVVLVSWQGKGAAAYDMQSGEKLWMRRTAPDCANWGFSGDRGILVVDECTPSGSDSDRFRVQKLEPRSGRVKWTYKADEGIQWVSLISSDPPVLGVGAGEADVTDLISLDERGKYRTTIRLDGGHYKVNCDTFLVDRCSRVVVGDGQAFITSEDDLVGAGHATNWVVGFDLATGKSRVKFDAGDDQLLHPIRMSGNKLLAYKSSYDNYAPQSLVSLDPASGKQREYFYFAVSSENIPLTYADNLSDVIVEDGRIFFGAHSVEGRGKKGDPSLVTTAFGIGRAG
ncbi:outer membrane protein assembly factor BamB family protein [Streptomyces beihaiensis]|uniref:PQQ-like beta-propeller repeat protein n=1 Tax=Streptomyces beihaiensis TaxID=2984495 RepID=A0ABT3TXK2_9ACTN|nr:PQQ-binding-like beta-propeller repeat protein [Streptomyces beihaiensis]MCX3061766.1 PQQ-like beta-propeller repeat protein [Streptomyces beihaiensis]